MERSVQERIVNAVLKSGLVDKDRLENLMKKSPPVEGVVSIKYLIDSDIISDKEFLIILSHELDMPLIDLTRLKIDESIIKLIPERIAKMHNVIAISRLGDNLTLAVCDPTNIFAMDDVKAVTKCDLSLVLSTRRDIQTVLHKYVTEEDVSKIISGEETSDVSVMERGMDAEILDVMGKSKTAPIVKMVSVMISEAIKKRASDIHIEPQETSLRVRYRIDGELHDVFDLPKKNQNAILARIKIMSNLDITETRNPQDGRFKVKLEGKEIDFRVSVLPTIYGNKVVLRALDKGNLSIGLESLGFQAEPLEDFKKALAMPYGIILVTGPTGSGKSTTLYSILNSLNVPERNIVTVEDPVEYQVEGITQVAAHQEIGLDFASGLRAILRQSPDVMMIGEIRDFETADIAIKASLTGHMVLSTLHTNDSVGAITRLINMGVEPFLIASSLILACAQRLLRKICPYCKIEANIPQKVLEELAEKFPKIRETQKFFMGKGCSKCNNTGFLGRMGTLETLLIDDKIREMINKEASEEDIKDYLKERGFKSLRENSMVSFCKGFTTLEEVIRNT